MSMVLLTSASTAPFLLPGDWYNQGHQVELIGCGGVGGAGQTGGTNTRPANGGGGGAYYRLIWASGSLSSATSFKISASNSATADQNTSATYWQGTTNSNTWEAQCGNAGQNSTVGGPGAGGAAVRNGTPPGPSYLSFGFSGGSGGTTTNSTTFTGSGGGGAGGPSGVGGTCAANTVNDGATGGGAGNGGGSSVASATTSGSAGAGPGGGAGGVVGGTESGGNASPYTSSGGGGGALTATAGADIHGGNGSGGSLWIDQTSGLNHGLTGGSGGGGGGGGNDTSTTAGSIASGGNGGDFGGGGGGGGRLRGTGTSNGGGAGGGIIAIAYQPLSMFVRNFAVWSALLLQQVATPAVVDNPPFSHPARNAVASEIVNAWQPDPWQYIYPTQTSRAPYAPGPLDPVYTAVRVDNPTPDADAEVNIRLITQAWQADPWPYAFQDGQQPYGTNRQDFIAGQSVDNPPFVHAARRTQQNASAQAWQPDAWPSIIVGVGARQFYAQGPVNPQIPGRSVDRPPSYADDLADMYQLVASWQPPPPEPTQKRKTQIVSVDNPPFLHEELDQAQAQIIRSWQPVDPPIQQRVYYPQVVEVVVTYVPPPPVADMMAIVSTWQLPDPQPTLPRKLNPFFEAVRVDDPPGFVNDYIPDQIDAFPYQQLYERTFYPIQPAVVVTYVPYTTQQLNIVAQWQLPDPQPQQRRPTQIVSVDNPPSFSDDLADMNQLVGSWQPPDPWPQQRRPTQVVSVDNPPPYAGIRADLYNVLQTWTPPDPFPTQPRYFYVQPFVVTYVPYSPEWLPGVLTAWQQADPQPQQRRTTFIPGSSVDNPPFISEELDQAANQIAQAWQPDAWRYNFPQQTSRAPYTPGPLNPSYTAVRVDNPPFQHMGRLALTKDIIAQWQPPDPQPVQRGPLPPAILAVRSDNPPFSHYGRLAVTSTLVGMWQPDPWYPTPLGPVTGRQPYGQRQLNPSITAVRVDNPPFSHFGRAPNMAVIWSTWPVDVPAQPAQIKYPQQLVVTYVPYTRPWLVNVLAQWQPVDPPPVQDRPMQIVSVDNPPLITGIRNDMLGSVMAWTPPDPWPTQRRPTQIVSVDNPPGFRPLLEDRIQIVQAWIPPDMPATVRRPTQIVSVDNPPSLRRPDTTRSWFDVPVQPFLPNRGIAAITVRVDFPPPRTLAWFPTVLNQWIEPPPRIEPQRRLFPAGLAVRVDNPPFDMRGHSLPHILRTWEPYDQPPNIIAYFRHYTEGKFIPFTQATIIKSPLLRGTLTVTTLIGRDGAPVLRGRDDAPGLTGTDAAPSLRGTRTEPDLDGDP